MITSRDNPKVKLLRSLHEARGRRSEGCYLLEGAILVAEALDAGVAPRLLLYDATALRTTRRGRRLLERLLALPGAEEALPAVIAAACDTVTPQGIVAAAPLPASRSRFAPHGLVVVLDGLHDPGNVGAILRTAEAAGCAGVAASQATADVFGPKVVRAAAGAHLRLPLTVDVAWPRLAEMLSGRSIYLAEARQGEAYYAVDWTQPAALVIGNETAGPRAETLRYVQGRVCIPMPGKAESLNAAIAASIIIFESVRQQQAKSVAP